MLDFAQAQLRKGMGHFWQLFATVTATQENCLVLSTPHLQITETSTVSGSVLRKRGNSS